MKRILLLITIVISVMAGLIGCRNEEAKVKDFIQDSELDAIVSQYLLGMVKKDLAPSQAQFEAHHILGKELDGNILNVYVEAWVSGYSFENKQFKDVTGGEISALIKIEKKQREYKVVQYMEAVASSDVEYFMPRKYAKKSLKYDNKKLLKDVIKQAECWQKEKIIK